MDDKAAEVYKRQLLETEADNLRLYQEIDRLKKDLDWYRKFTKDLIDDLESIQKTLEDMNKYYF